MSKPQICPAMATWEAWSTSVTLIVADGRALARARRLVERELELIDRAASRFRADSELSRVNAHAGGRAAAIGPLLVEALDVALRAARLTDGDVDPTVGRALEIAGYDRDWPLVRASATRAGARARPTLEMSARPDWRTVRLDRARGTVALPRGVKLDLGATAKAWAADRASRVVHEATAVGVLVSIGGDVGTCGAPPEGGWRVHVTDDHRAGPDAPGQRVAIHGGGLATSSVAVRRWWRAGEEMHHVIDPSTGAPSQGPWRTASVAAASCVDANTASTAALVRGARAPKWLTELGLPARLAGHTGEVLTLGAWPAEREELAA